MRPGTRATVERATVRLPRLGGLGVLVPGLLIVTAAHVIGWSAQGDMALGDEFVERVEAAGGALMEARALAVEPVADIAVLGARDDQTAPSQAETFEAFCGSTKPVALCTDDFPLLTRVPAHVLTHLGGWVEATAQQYAVNASTLTIEAREDIVGGTSGGPVVTDAGCLLGVVSWAGGVTGASRTVCIPRVHLAVPGWLARRMLDPGWEIRATRKEGRRFMKIKAK